MDSRRAPQPVGQAHVADQTPDLDWNLWPAATRARLPAPIQAEARPMPTDYRLGLNNSDGVQHRREQPIEPDEEQSVGDRQFGLRGDASAQHVQLMPQHHNLRFQPRPRLERRYQDMQGEAQKRDHGGSAYSIPPLTPVDGVFGMDTRIHAQSVPPPPYPGSATASWTVRKTVPDHLRLRYAYPAWALGFRPFEFFDRTGTYGRSPHIGNPRNRFFLK